MKNFEVMPCKDQKTSKNRTSKKLQNFKKLLLQKTFTLMKNRLTEDMEAI